MSGMDQKDAVHPQLQFFNKVVDIPFVPQRQFPEVQAFQKTKEIPQLLFDFWWSTSLFPGRHHPCRDAEAHPMVSVTMEIPHLPVDTEADVPVVLVVRVHRCRLHLVRKLVAGSP